MHYILYHIANKINNKKYIGIHSTNDLNDGYLGSGIAIKNALKKYGRENFVREILFHCECPQHLEILEEEFVNEDFVKRNDTYNLVSGGRYRAYISDETKRKIRNSVSGEKNGFYGKTHTNEMKSLSSKINKDTVFIHNDKTCIRIKRNELQSYLNDGWNIGKKFMNTGTLGTKWIHNDSENKSVPKEEVQSYLNDGWKLGRLKTSKKTYNSKENQSIRANNKKINAWKKYCKKANIQECNRPEEYEMIILQKGNETKTIKFKMAQLNIALKNGWIYVRSIH